MKRKTKVTIAAYAALTVGAVLPLSAAELTHQWSFNGDLADSVGGAVAEKIGENVTTGPFCAVLWGDGYGTGSLILGTNILDTTEATIEIWAAQNVTRNYSRVFDYGSDDKNYVECTWSNGTDLNKSAIGFRRNDSGTCALMVEKPNGSGEVPFSAATRWKRIRAIRI